VPNAASVIVRPYIKRLSGLCLASLSNNAPRSSRVNRKALSRAVVDTLENRQMLSVSLVNGWTEVSPPAGAKVVYVSSSSGSDSNNGLSPSSPVRSINRGEKLLRSGAGDQLLLKRGDTFRESFGYWDVSGKDANNPTVIGAYGSGNRPVIASGSKNGFNTSFGGVSNIAIIGLHFTASGRGGAVPDGIVSTGRSSNLLIEDVKVEGYRNNLDLEDFLGKIYNVKIRRSIILDSYSRSTHSQGLYADGVHGLLLEGNVFDHNGWGNGAGQTLFNHNAYVTAKCTGLTAKDNVFSNASSHGLQARPGGTVTGNAFINNGVGLSYGLVNGSGIVTAGGVTGSVSNNIFYGGHSIGGKPAGVGIELSNIRSATVSDNLFQIGDPNTPNPAISISNISGTQNRNAAVGILGLNITNNTVYGWNQGIRINGGFTVRNLSVRGNDFQNMKHYQAVTNYSEMSGQSWGGNRYHVPKNSKSPVILGGRSLSIDAWARSYDSGAQNTIVKYPDTGRSPTRYAGDFIARVRGLSKSSWDSKYTSAPLISYLKGGFRGGNPSAQPVPNSPASPPPTSTPSSPPSSGGSVGVSVNDIRSTEGNSGLKNFTFTISLSSAASKQVAVRWETKGGSGVVGGDYVGRNGTVYFNAGETKKTVTIQVKSNTIKEPDETFYLNLLSATNATLADKQGAATIINDDGTSSGSLGVGSGSSGGSLADVRVSDVRSTEGNYGLKTFTFNLSLDSAASKQVAVRWETRGETGKVGKDYVGRNGTVYFNAGQTKKSVSIQVKSDKVKEADETFILKLLSATNATIADSIGRATIVNDDGTPSSTL